MANRWFFVLFVFLCIATLACRKSPKSFAEWMRERYTNEAFTISFRDPLPDGRPVVAIDWASSRSYPAEPLRGYRLLVRRNGTPYYMRTFGSDEYRDGFALDLDMRGLEIALNDSISVRVEVNIDERAEDSIVLSNSLTLDLPPNPAAGLAVQPSPSSRNQEEESDVP